MSAGTVVAVIWVLVFIIGVVVGVIAIIALSVLRKDRKDRQGPDDPDDWPDDLWPERDHGVSGIAGRWDFRPRWPDDPAAPDRRTDEGKS
jgi:hypothetical protein